MSSLKGLKGTQLLHSLFVDSINNLNELLTEELDKINLEHKEKIINEKIRLLLLICENEGLNFNQIKTKYLTTKELTYLKNDREDTVNIQQLLDKITINEIEYYYEPKEKGLVYDSNSKKVGFYKNGKVILRRV